MRRLIAFAITAAIVTITTVLPAAEPPPVPDNANIVRQHTGVLGFRSLSTGATRGEEHFHITAHPDGSRTVSAVSRYGPRDIQRHSMVRISAGLRIHHATLHYWIEGAWRASGTLSTAGDDISVMSYSPSGTHQQTFSVSGPFWILPHHLTPDSMRVLMYDKAAGGVQTFTVYDPSPLADGGSGLLGTMAAYPLSYLGEKEVTVPAGTFTVDHFRAWESTDLFVTGPDAVLVKWSFPRIDREHVLLSLESLHR